jgi:alpha-ribazole phosphatase
MDIYLIRHTETDTPKGWCYGQTDVGLAQSFPDEVRLLQRKLPELQPDCLIFSSPLSRCLKLAEQFASDIMVDPRLQELDFGDWENRSFATLDAQLLKDWSENFVHLAPPDGECFRELVERVRTFWNELVAQSAQQAVVFTHAGVIRACLAIVLELPLAKAFHFKVDPGSLHKLEHAHAFTYIHFLNQ